MTWLMTSLTTSLQRKKLTRLTIEGLKRLLAEATLSTNEKVFGQQREIPTIIATPVLATLALVLSMVLMTTVTMMTWMCLAMAMTTMLLVAIWVSSFQTIKEAPLTRDQMINSWSASVHCLVVKATRKLAQLEVCRLSVEDKSSRKEHRETQVIFDRKKNQWTICHPL